jgi:hypothetical protein
MATSKSPDERPDDCHVLMGIEVLNQCVDRAWRHLRIVIQKEQMATLGIPDNEVAACTEAAS